MIEVFRRAILLKFLAAEVNSSYFYKYLIDDFDSLQDRFQDQIIVIEIGLCHSSSN